MGIRETGKVSFNGKKQASASTIKPMSLSNGIKYSHREKNADQIATTILNKDDIVEEKLES